MKLKEQSNIFPDIFNKTQVKPKSKYKNLQSHSTIGSKSRQKKTFPTIHNDAHFAVMNRKEKKLDLYSRVFNLLKETQQKLQNIPRNFTYTYTKEKITNPKKTVKYILKLIKSRKKIIGET